jgi:hypothetical protein
VNKPVFYDDSGVRAVAMQWTGRTTCLLGALVCLGVAATLGAHVTLPGLERLNRVAGVSQPSGPSRSAERPVAIEPLPPQRLSEDARQVGTGRAAVAAPKPPSPKAKLTRPGIERSVTIPISRTDKVAGTTAKTDNVPTAVPAGPNPIAQRPAAPGARRNAGASKADQAPSRKVAGGSSAHPASRAATAAPNRGVQAHTRSVKPARPLKHGSAAASAKTVTTDHPAGAPAS